jgi:hypothetical protein
MIRCLQSERSNRPLPIQSRSPSLCRGRDAGYPAPPAQIPAGGFSRTGLFRSTRSRMCRRAFPGEQEPQDSLTETEFLLARHFLSRPFHDPQVRYLEAIHQAVHSPPRQTPSWTAPVQPFVERPACFLMGELHAAGVADQPVIVPRSLQLNPGRSPHPRHWLHPSVRRSRLGLRLRPTDR